MSDISIAVVVILAVLVPVLFQLIIQGRKRESEHREIMEILRKLEQSKGRK